MDVKDFIKDTISQIADAIRELNEENKGVMRVNVCSEAKRSNAENKTWDGVDANKKFDFYYETMLDFNLALTVNAKTETKGKVGIMTSFVGFGVKGESATENAVASTVSFKIPAMLPQG